MHTRNALTVTAGLAAVILLTGCSGGNSSAATHSAAPTTSSTADAAAAPSSPTSTGDPGMITVKQGHWSAKAGDRIKVTKVTCGLAEIPHVKLNPDWPQVDGAPEFVAYHAAKGEQLCDVHGKYQNASTAPSGLDGFGNVTTSDGYTYQPTDRDQTVMLQLPSHTDSVNPGKSASWRYIISIPKGKTLSGIEYPLLDPWLTFTLHPVTAPASATATSTPATATPSQTSTPASTPSCPSWVNTSRPGVYISDDQTEAYSVGPDHSCHKMTDDD